MHCACVYLSSLGLPVGLGAEDGELVVGCLKKGGGVRGGEVPFFPYLVPCALCVLFLVLHSISCTGTQVIPKNSIGLGGGTCGRVGEGLAEVTQPQ